MVEETVVDLGAYVESGQVKPASEPVAEPSVDTKEAAAEEWARLLATVAAPLVAPGQEEEFARLYAARVKGAFVAFDISTALPGAAVALDALPPWVRAICCAGAAVAVGIWVRNDLTGGGQT